MSNQNEFEVGYTKTREERIEEAPFDEGERVDVVCKKVVIGYWQEKPASLQIIVETLKSFEHFKKNPQTNKYEKVTAPVEIACRVSNILPRPGFEYKGYATGPFKKFSIAAGCADTIQKIVNWDELDKVDPTTNKKILAEKIFITNAAALDKIRPFFENKFFNIKIGFNNGGYYEAADVDPAGAFNEKAAAESSDKPKKKANF